MGQHTGGSGRAHWRATPLGRLKRRILRTLAVLPPAEPLRPVVYSVRLLAYVGIVTAVAAALGLATVRPPADWATLFLGMVTILAISVYAVRSFSGIDATWSATVSVHLGLVLTLGPVGALGAALADSLISVPPDGWFRTTFNAANQYLADMAAWGAFVISQRAGSEVWMIAFGGVVAGAAQWLVNHLLVAVVVKLNNPEATVVAFLSDTLANLPYSLGYGWSAAGFVLLHQRTGALGFTFLLTPILLLQGFLVVLARRAHVHDVARAQHAREREALLQRVIDASAEERRRIAADLHDGVVQNLAGTALTLSAQAQSLRSQSEVAAAANTIDAMADQTRQAQRDLRSLVLQIAPPDLDATGLERVVGGMLAPLRACGIDAEFEDRTQGVRLGPQRLGLLFRVAQEALRNVTSHASAKRVRVILEPADGAVALTISDDGRGFSPDDLAHRQSEGHLGLSLLMRGVMGAGGNLSVASEPGQGTTVRLEISAAE